MDDIGMYYDRQGRPLGMTEWGEKHADKDYLIVAQHWVRGWMVSTVWLGIDHGFGMGRAPVIFETMIFPPGDETEEDESTGSERYAERYATEEAAQAGHDRALSWLAEKIGADAMADITGPLVPGSSDEDWDGSIEGER
jgi:hypothetical protein